jgi:hypothetical protein
MKDLGGRTSSKSLFSLCDENFIEHQQAIHLDFATRLKNIVSPENINRTFFARKTKKEK